VQGVRGTFIVLFEEEMRVILDLENGNRTNLFRAYREEEDL
jgi:hypothetical protein